MKDVKDEKIRRSGFTLVELLIVIIIGILAGMLLMSTGSVTRKAKDTKAINDIIVIKEAVMLALAENSISTKNQLFIVSDNGTLTVTHMGSHSMSNAKKEALRKTLKAAFDGDIASKKFAVVYDVDGELALSYYPKQKETYPYYYIYSMNGGKKICPFIALIV